MFSQYFGDYLLKNNQITPDQLDRVMEYQNTNRAKLGLIAVSEGLLAAEQAEELNGLQALQDKRFGDLAVEKGYLTEKDVSQLLKLQGNPYLIFIQALEENGIMSQQDAEIAVADFQKERRLSNTGLSNIKNGNVNDIIPVFVHKEDNLYLSAIGLSLRNILRLITTHFRFEQSQQTRKYTAKYIAFQKTVGDHNGFLGFASDDDSILTIADGYAHEVFDRVDEDSMDSVCEFINCINGLYATQLSTENINIDMQPPGFYIDNKTVIADEIIVIPIFFDNKKIDLIVSIDCSIQFE